MRRIKRLGHSADAPAPIFWQAFVSNDRRIAYNLNSFGAHDGFVVTGGKFTQEAKEFAQQTRIELIDGKALEKRIGSVAVATSRSESIAQPATPSGGADSIRGVPEFCRSPEQREGSPCRTSEQPERPGQRRRQGKP